MGKQKKQSKFPQIRLSATSLKHKKKHGQHNHQKSHVTAKLKEQFRNLDRNLRSQTVYTSLYPTKEQQSTSSVEQQKKPVERTKPKTASDYLIQEYARTEKLCQETISQLSNTRLNDK